MTALKKVKRYTEKEMLEAPETGYSKTKTLLKLGFKKGQIKAGNKFMAEAKENKKIYEVFILGQMVKDEWMTARKQLTPEEEKKVREQNPE